MHANFCPCGNPKTYANCCQPYLENEAFAPNAECLMRSRYTAYVQDNITYLEQTAAGEAKQNFDFVATQTWNKTLKWLGLKILAQQTKQGNATIEFIARFQQQAVIDGIHEISQFKCIEGRWFYLGGAWLNFPKQNLSLNSPCWCGAPKKFKNCHVK
jgi:SEC-C motif-containing protein